MEEDKNVVETPASSAPPTKKIKLDSEDGNKGNISVTDKQSAQPLVDEHSKSNKHAAEDSESPVSKKKLKQDDANGDVVTDTKIVKESGAGSSEKQSGGENAKSGNSNNAVEKDKFDSKDTKTGEGKVSESPAGTKPEAPQTLQGNDKTGVQKSPKEKTVGGATQVIENKSPDTKPPGKVLKKLPGLNPIRPMGMTGPKMGLPHDSLLKQQLSVNIESMGAPANRAMVSPVRVSPNAASPKSPGRSPTSPGNPRMRISPARQMSGATLSPVSHMGATILPVKQTNKSPVPQLQRSGLSISPVKQQPGLTISPVRQTKNEMNMTPFFSGEVTISPIKQQGVTISPARQPQLSPDIRSQIPEGISITAIPSMKAKSPVRQTMPKPAVKVVSPPKGMTQQIRPQAQIMRNLLESKPQDQKVPVMVQPKKKTSPEQPKQQPLKVSPNKPATETKPTPPPQQPVKAVPAPKPIEKDEKMVVEEEKPVPKPETKTQDVEMAEVPANTKEPIQPEPTKEDPIKTTEPAVKPEAQINKEATSDTTDKLTEEASKQPTEAEKKPDTKDKEESSSEDDESGSDSEESEDEDDAKGGRPARGAQKGKKTPGKNLATPSRALRARKSAAVDVAVKLTRIDQDLEDGALPPWSVKKHMENKSAKSSEKEDSESGEEDEASDDDNSNSQGSKSAQSSTNTPGGPRRRGRPRKDYSTPTTTLDLDELTGHDSLHAALKQIVEDEGLEPGTTGSESEEPEEEEEEGEGRKATKALLSMIPFFSRRGGRGGVKGKAIGKNNQFDSRVIDRMEEDKKYRNEMLRLYQEDRQKREEKKKEKMEEARKKVDERIKAAAEKKEKLKAKAEERRRKYEEQKLKKLEEAKKREETKRLRASLTPVMNIDDDTRMSFPRTPGKMVGKFESLEDGEKSESRGKRGKMDVVDFDSQKEFSVHNLAEYQWPLQGGEHFMIQEQVAAYLEIKSFKRKYPDLKRRGLEPEERTYICDSGLVSEAMIELGLTAVVSADIMDIMFVDFPEKYEEVKKYSREKQARELIDRQRAMYDTTISEQTAKDLKESLVESTALWNAQFNRLRRETRQCSLDLQTFIVHYPAKPQRPVPKVGHYPVAILPGQYTDYYKEYTPTELRYLPLNTVLYGPMQPNERFLGDMSYSEASQSDTDDTSGSSDSSSGSSSDGSSTSGSDGDTTSDDEDMPQPLPPTPMMKKQSSTGGATQGDTPSRKPPPSGRKAGGGQSQEAEAVPPPQPMEIKEEGDGVGAVSSSMKPPAPAPVPPSAKCKACDRDSSSGEMIQCGKCVRYLHPPCLDLPAEMLPHMRLYDWQCSDCKSCVTCEKAQDDDKMLFCDLCDRGYHNYCIGLDKIPTGRWHCKVCSVCNSCNSREPNPEWEHEVKKGPKGQSVYQRTLCTPCAKSSDNNSRSQRR